MRRAIRQHPVLTGLRQPNLSRIETGLVAPRKSTLNKIAEALDVEPALADLREALAATADPALANEARLLRARLLRASDPVVAWNECLRTIEVARDHGLLRHEVLAWGLIGEELVALGHTEEALERLRSGIDRLLAQGERRAAQDARLALVRVQCAAGRMADARKTGFDALTGGPPSLGGLDAPALVQAIVAQVDAHAAGAPQADDMTLLVAARE